MWSRKQNHYHFHLSETCPWCRVLVYAQTCLNLAVVKLPFSGPCKCCIACLSSAQIKPTWVIPVSQTISPSVPKVTMAREKSNHSLWVNMANLKLKFQMGINEEKNTNIKRRKQIVKVTPKRNTVNPWLRKMMSFGDFWSQLSGSQDRLWQKPPQTPHPTLQHWPDPIAAFSEHVGTTKQH